MILKDKFTIKKVQWLLKHSFWDPAFDCISLPNKKQIIIIFVIPFVFKGSESPEKHFFYVCEHFISKAAAQKIVVVAHSYGGVVIVEGVSEW